MAAEQTAGVEELYKNFGVLADAGEKAGEKVAEYEGILQAAKGSANEKKLAAGFITRFYHLFPSLAEAAMDTLLDLVEEESDTIRRTAIKALPDLCKRSSEAVLCTKVSEYLTQLLATDDAVDLGLVKTGLASLLQKNTTAAMDGVFSQVGGEDEGVREKAIEYVSSSLMSMRHILFIPHPENEKHLVSHVKKVLADVTGEEFEVFMEMLSKLQFLATADGAREVMSVIVQQAELSAEFKPGDGETVDRFVTCFKQALKFCKRGCEATPFVLYLCQTILPVFSGLPEGSRQEVLRLLAEGFMYSLPEDSSLQCLPPVFTLLLEYVPLPPAEEEEAPSFQYSTVECLLFAFHQLVQKSPGFLTDEENAERLKDFKKRLQYFARKCQTYHSSLQAAVKSKTSDVEVNDEQAKLRTVALKITANLSTLIRDFFHNPPSYQAKVKLSWGAEKTVIQRKRPTSTSSEATPTKRRPSPIRFGEGESNGGSQAKRADQGLYQPPRDRFSKNIGGSPSFTGRGGGRGRGRGRGWRGGF